MVQVGEQEWKNAEKERSRWGDMVEDGDTGKKVEGVVNQKKANHIP